MPEDLKFPKPKRVKLTQGEYWKFKLHVHQVDGWRCKVCDRHKPLTIHHLIKRSKQRLDILENCISVCVECHDEIEAHKIDVRFDPKSRKVEVVRL